MPANDEIEKWFHQYSDHVDSYLAYYIGSLDVDDLVQETFPRSLKGQWNFQGYASPKTWLCTIARHVATHHQQHGCQRRTIAACGKLFKSS